MKACLTMLMAGMLLCGAAYAQRPDNSEVLGTAKTYSTAPGVHYERDTTLMRDGSLRGVVHDGSVVTHVDMSIKNGQLLIVRRSPWGTSTSVNSIEGFEAFEQAHPEEAAAYRQAQIEFKQTLARHQKTTHGVSALTDGPCGSAYDAMIQAGDNAIATCASGDGQACIAASNAWHSAVASCNACLEAQSLH